MRDLLYLMVVFLSFASAEVKTLSMRPFIENPEEYTYSRGRYLIILGNNAFTTLISDENVYGDFVSLKKSQGYDVDVETYSSISPSNSITELKDWLENYSDIYPLLEYVLLVGDVSNFAEIGTHRIPSYNELEQDATDYPYTFFSEDEMYNPRFFIGRWSVSDVSEFLSLKHRTIDYQTIDETENLEYLNKTLLVAGSYKTDAGSVPVPSVSWPLTPYWTSLWIQDELEADTFMSVDTALFHADNQVTTTIDIINPWNEGIGIVNYRGWGNATGWTKPQFKLDDINDIINDEDLPVVWSFVCNTGDFGNETNDRCFGEKLTTYGSASSPKGAVAVIAPSDLDTDTRFNNVLCGQMWDEMIEGRIYELAPILHAGKQAVAKEFEGLEIPSVNGGTMSIPKFYHHVYSVLGDPSLSVWFGEPNEMSYLLSSPILTQSNVSLSVVDHEGVALQDVVGAILDDENNLIAKGCSNEDGLLNIDFSDIADGTQLELYLNASQFLQKKIELTFHSDDGSNLVDADYNYNLVEPTYTQYSAISSVDVSDDAPVYNWIEINTSGTDLELQDDTFTRIPIGFDFTYFDQVYDSITVCSNGWVSLDPCTISHFWNFSIPFPMGPNALIAPFMDDLDDNVGTEPFHVYSYLDTDNNQLIIEWDDVANGEDDEYCGTEQDCTRETFQLILKNHGYENGDILFQYKDIHDIDENGNYSTIGIESPDQNFGYQYQFRNISYGTQLVENEMAILFTTNSDFGCLGNTDDCVQDCAGEWGGVTELDECGICAGDNSGCTDCNGVINGDAYIDGCSICVGGNTGSEACPFDCNGIAGGSALFDNCGVCDSDSTNDCLMDCAGVLGGLALSDECGICNEPICSSNPVMPSPFNPGYNPCENDEYPISTLWNNTCLDCHNMPNGEALNDECGNCGNGCFNQDCENYPSGEFDCEGTLLLIDELLPLEFGLLQNFPNPFNPTTTISFNLDKSETVNMSIFDLNGIEVFEVINNQFYSAGQHSINIDSVELSSGLYFYQLRSGKNISTKKMLLLK